MFDSVVIFRLRLPRFGNFPIILELNLPSWRILTLICISKIWKLLRIGCSGEKIRRLVMDQFMDFFFSMANFLSSIWKDLALAQTKDNESQYRIWDYPIKEEYGHILRAIEVNYPVPNASYGFKKVYIDRLNDLLSLKCLVYSWVCSYWFFRSSKTNAENSLWYMTHRR